MKKVKQNVGEVLQHAVNYDWQLQSSDFEIFFLR